jgi:spermidine synthase
MEGGLFFIPGGEKLGRYGFTVDRVFFTGKTRLQNMTIAHSPVVGTFLALDNIVQSSEYDYHIYHESIVHPAMMLLDKPKRALIIGGGEGTTAAEIIKHPGIEVDFVEIDRDVLEKCRKYLPYSMKKKDKRVKLTIGDGLKFLENSKGKYDLIISDLTDAFGSSMLSQRLYSKEFARLVSSKLTDNGVYITIGSGFENGVPKYLLRPEYLKGVFKVIRPFSFYMPAFKVQMFMTLASKGRDPLKISRDEIAERIRPIKKNLRFYNENTHYAIFDPSYFSLIEDPTMW